MRKGNELGPGCLLKSEAEGVVTVLPDGREAGCGGGMSGDTGGEGSGRRAVRGRVGKDAKGCKRGAQGRSDVGRRHDVGRSGRKFAALYTGDTAGDSAGDTIRDAEGSPSHGTRHGTRHGTCHGTRYALLQAAGAVHWLFESDGEYGGGGEGARGGARTAGRGGRGNSGDAGETGGVGKGEGEGGAERGARLDTVFVMAAQMPPGPSVRAILRFVKNSSITNPRSNAVY